MEADWEDDIGTGLLRAAAELQAFATEVLGIELDSVAPDLQGARGWTAAASLACETSSGVHRQALLLRFGPAPEDASWLATAASAQPGDGGRSVTLEDFLDEIGEPPWAGLQPPVGEPASMHLPRGCKAHLDSLASSQLSILQQLQLNHPNMAVLMDPLVSPDGAPPHAAAAAQQHPAPSPTTPPAPSPPPAPTNGHQPAAPTPTSLVPPPLTLGTLGLCWHPGCSLADCLRQPTTAAAAGCALGPGHGACSRLADQQLRFLLLQLVAAVCYMHGVHGVAVGGVAPESMMLRPGGWLQLLPPPAARAPRPPAQPSCAPAAAQSASGVEGRAEEGAEEGAAAAEGEEPAERPGGQQGGEGSEQGPGPAEGSRGVVAAEGAGRALLRLPRLPACLHPLPPLPALTRAWQQRALSNLDYLMLLNLMAGRRLGDRTLHPFVPWVTDFSVDPRVMLGLATQAELQQQRHAQAQALLGSSGNTDSTSSTTSSTGTSSGSQGNGPDGLGGGVGGSAAGSGGAGDGAAGGGGWHDLGVTRYRAAKGDEQLDYTFQCSDPPHHIPHEPLSELSYCIYLARVTPRPVLQRAVRANFQPREYPASVEAMLRASPDECLPQLYSDPGVFRSQHPELPDLLPPAWAHGPEDFIRWHRALLESDAVSSRLHRWIDLMFGHQLLGPAAVAAKNVHLSLQPSARGLAGGGGTAGAALGGGGGGAGGPGALRQVPPAASTAAAAVAGSAFGVSGWGGGGGGGGMHAPLFLTPHPPRGPDPAVGAFAAAGRAPGRGLHWVSVAQGHARGARPGPAQVGTTAGAAAARAGPSPHTLAPPPAASASRAVAIPSGSFPSGGGGTGRGSGHAAAAGGAGGRGAGAWSPDGCGEALDSVELLGVVAAREGGSAAVLLEDYFSPPSADSVLQQAVQQQQWPRQQQQQQARGYPGGSAAAAAAAARLGALGAGTQALGGPQGSAAVWRDADVAAWGGAATPQGPGRAHSSTLGPAAAGDFAHLQGGASGLPGHLRRMPSAPLPAWTAAAAAPEAAAWVGAAAGGGAEGPWGGRPALEGGGGDPAAAAAAALMADVQAVGHVAVQLYLGRTVYGTPAAPSSPALPSSLFSVASDPGMRWPLAATTAAAHPQPPSPWADLARRLPVAARRFVGRCLSGDPKVSAERLLDDPFFGPELHTAHALLRNTLYDTPPAPAATSTVHGSAAAANSSVALGSTGACGELPLLSAQPGAANASTAWVRGLPLPPPWLLPQQLAALAAAARSGDLERAAEQPPALDLCLPHIMHVLWQLAVVACGTGRDPWRAVAGWLRCAPHAQQAPAQGGGADAAPWSGGGGGGGGEVGGGGAVWAPAAAGEQLLWRMGAQAAEVLTALMRLLPPNTATAHVLPYVCYCLACFAEDGSVAGGVADAAASAGTARGVAARGPGDGSSTALSLAHRLLRPSLHLQLLQGTDLDAYAQHVLPLLLAGLLCSAHAAPPTSAPPPGAAAGNAATAGTSPDPWDAGSGAGGSVGGSGADGAGVATAEGPGALAAAAAGGASGGGSGTAGGVARALAVSSVSDAAAAALVALAPRLPLPLLLERVLGPLLTCLSVGSSVQRLLAQLCVEMGGQFAARHVVPALLHLAVLPAAPGGRRRPPSTSGGSSSSGSKAPAAAAQQAGAGGGTAGTAAGGGAGGSSTARGAVSAELQHQIYSALSVLGATLDLLPSELIPRAFMHGLAPQASPVATPPSPPTSLDGSAGGGGAGSSGGGGGAGGGGGFASGALPPLLSVLLDPAAFVVVPGSLTLLAALSLRAFVRLARPENLAWVVLPHLMPLLSNPGPRRRAAYRANGTPNGTPSTPAAPSAAPSAAAGAAGSGAVATVAGEAAAAPAEPLAARAGAGAGASSRRRSEVGDEEGGYWELVQCIYGELVSSSGLLTVRGLLPGWQALEAGLAARLGWSPAAAAGGWGAGGAAGPLPGSGGGSGGSGAVTWPDAAPGSAEAGGAGTGGGGLALSLLEQQVQREIAQKQQQVAALHGTHLFMKGVGWSAPNSLRSSPKDVPAPTGQQQPHHAHPHPHGSQRPGHPRSGPAAAGQHGGGGVHPPGSVSGGEGSGSDDDGPETEQRSAFAGWPPLLAIGSPTLAGSLAVGSAAISRQASAASGVSLASSSAAAAAAGAGGGGAVGKRAGGGVAGIRTAPAPPGGSGTAELQGVAAADGDQRVGGAAAGGDGAGALAPHSSGSRSLSASDLVGGTAAALLPAGDGDAAASDDVNGGGGGGGRGAATDLSRTAQGTASPLAPGDGGFSAGGTAPGSGAVSPRSPGGAAQGPFAVGSPPLDTGSQRWAWVPAAPLGSPAPPLPHASPEHVSGQGLRRSGSGDSVTSTSSAPGAPAAPLPAVGYAPSAPTSAGPSTSPSSSSRPAHAPSPASGTLPAGPHTHRSGPSPPSSLGALLPTPASRAARARLLEAAFAPPAAGDVWSLQAAVVHSWPAHKDRVRALAAHPNECSVLTAGRGAVPGRDGPVPVVRVWSLSDCQARVQYSGHRASVCGLLVLRAARAAGGVAASLDASGQLHVWSCDTGQAVGVLGPAAGAGGLGGDAGRAAGGGGGLAVAGSGGSGGAVELGGGGEGATAAAWVDLVERSGRYAQQQPPLQRSHTSGAAAARGWATMGGMLTAKQLAEAAAPHSAAAAGAGAGGQAAASTAGAAGGAAGAGLRCGYTALCAAPEEHRALYAGTADARVVCVDLERCRVAAEWVAAPSVRLAPEDAITAVVALGGGAQPPQQHDGLASGGGGGVGAGLAGEGWQGGMSAEVLAAGSRGGRVVVLDRRCGTVAAAWRAHGGEVGALAGYGSHVLLSAGGDKQLRVWDLRKAAAGGAAYGGGGGMSAAAAGGGGGAAVGGVAGSGGSGSFPAATTTAAGAGGAAGMGLDAFGDGRAGPWVGWDGMTTGGASGGVGGDPLLGIVDALSPLGVGAVVSYNGGAAAPSAAAPTGRLYGAYGTLYDVTLPPGGMGGVAAPPQPNLLRSFPLPREGVYGLQVLRDCVLMTSGSSLGVLSLSGLAGGAGGGGQGPSFIKLRNGRGGRENAVITSLAVLPCCRLLVVAGEDGVVRICR